MIYHYSGPGAGQPCVFPFKLQSFTAYGCVVDYEGEKVEIFGIQLIIIVNINI